MQNITDSTLITEDINCIVGGIAQKEYDYGKFDFPFKISPNLTVSGSATFMVPKDATEYDIKYGDYVTIHIEK